MMSTTVATINTSIEPITLAEAKSHLKITDSNSDAEITDFIGIAREYIENLKGVSLTRQTKELFLDEFPSGDIEIYDSPVQSITSITYVDADGNSQTVTSSDYSLDSYSDPVRIENLTGWPGAKSQNKAITVKYVSGFNKAFTAATDDTITSTAHGFDNGMKLQVKSSDTLPGGLSVNTNYYVIGKAADTFKVSANSGGSAVDVTDTGTGVHEVDLVPWGYKQAILLAVGELYRNREEPKLNGVQSLIETIKPDAFS